MANNILALLTYLFSGSAFLALLIPKADLLLLAFAVTEEFWPVTHSPLLLLQVVLYQTSRLKRTGKYLNAIGLVLIIFAVGNIELLNCILIFSLAFLWHHTARPGFDDRSAWKLIKQRQDEVFERAMAVMTQLGVVQTDWILDFGSEIDEDDDKVQGIESEGEAYSHGEREKKGDDSVWIQMDNAPPLDRHADAASTIRETMIDMLKKEGLLKIRRLAAHLQDMCPRVTVEFKSKDEE